MAYFPIEEDKLWTLPPARDQSSESSEPRSASYYNRVGALTTSGTLLMSERDEVDECLDVLGKFAQEDSDRSLVDAIDEAKVLLDERWDHEEEYNVYEKWE